MTNKTTLQLALDALKLAAECGGELDREVYLEATGKLEEMVREVNEYNAKMDRDERAPEGDDYNNLLSILELHPLCA